MKKTLAEYDDLYRNSIQNMDKDVRIQYCYDLIDKNQEILASRGSDLPKLKRFELTSLIEAAQKELGVLRETKSHREEERTEQSKKFD